MQFNSSSFTECVTLMHRAQASLVQGLWFQGLQLFLGTDAAMDGGAVNTVGPLLRLRPMPKDNALCLRLCRMFV